MIKVGSEDRFDQIRVADHDGRLGEDVASDEFGIFVLPAKID